MERPKDLAYARWLAEYYLSHRPLTRHELYDKLDAKQVPKNFIMATINQLEKAGYINDFEVAVKFINDSVTLKKRGKMRIIQELHFKGVNSETIDRAFAEADPHFDEALRYVLERKSAGLDLSNKKDKDKLIRHLAGRGFKLGDILAAIDEYLAC